MEDILSSIKRIIAEEGDSAGAVQRVRRAGKAPQPRADPVDPSDGHEDVLELSDQMSSGATGIAAAVSEPVPSVTSAAAPAGSDRAHPPGGVPDRAAALADAIVSRETAEASRGPLDALSRLIVRPEVTGSDTLEGMVRELLRPMLRDWLDAKLPSIVETMVSREIARITSQAD